VPFQAGVSADLLFRGIAEAARRIWVSPSSSTTSPAAAATLGPATIAGTAKPNGYTIGQITITAFRVPHAEGHLRSVTDFTLT